MIDATQIRKNMILKMDDGQLWRCVEMQLITPGRWKAMVQTKLRSLRDNSVKDHRFRSIDRVEQVHLDEVAMEYLYAAGDEHIFMNHETFDQVHLSPEVIGEAMKYLIPNVVFTIEMFDGKAMNVVPPITMVLTVAETEPNIKGATASASFKPAVMENGITIMVPPFVVPGEKIKVDTREDKYLERVK
ncbi:MAG: elongation factor P [Candidatus Aminicenantes bacterium]|nr:elongation factor P [Candidatus Aminicenantes bacterium]